MAASITEPGYTGTVVKENPVAALNPAPALPFGARGPCSGRLIDALGGGGLEGIPAVAEQAVERSVDPVRDDDLQLSLFVLYAQSYASLPQLDADLEWSTGLIEARTTIEAAFETALREQVTMPELPPPDADATAEALFALTAAPGGPSLARYVAKKADYGQLHELMVQRSIYTLREADPHTWAIPRLTGRAKAALVEIQADEYGGGRPERVHQAIFAGALRAMGLSDRYGSYVDHVPAITLASFNMMSMFALNRRLLGAIVGHLAAYEMTASIPCRLYADGLRRHGISEEATWYFDEHVEADAVHEQIAGRDLAGALAQDRPDLVGDIMFGAAACLAVDGAMGEHILTSWRSGRSSLVQPLAAAA